MAGCVREGILSRSMYYRNSRQRAGVLSLLNKPAHLKIKTFKQCFDLSSFLIKKAQVENIFLLCVRCYVPQWCCL